MLGRQQVPPEKTVMCNDFGTAVQKHRLEMLRGAHMQVVAVTRIAWARSQPFEALHGKAFPGKLLLGGDSS